RLRTERDRGHDHPRRANPALRAAELDKRMLQRMLAAESFDGRDAGAIDLRERHQAGVDRETVNQHRTGAALSFAAALFRSGQMAGFPEHIEKPRHRMRPHAGPFAIQREAHAAMIFSGVAGMSRTSTPAWRIALTTAGAGPSIGISPTPFAPNGPRGYGFSISTTS